ncbi:hypothetical protein FRC06_001543, partial [Ceratobasidium sp. 370]
ARGVTLAQPAPEPVTMQPKQSVDEQLASDTGLEFPLIREWLESIVDTHPRLVAFADVLEAQGLVHLNDIDNSDLTVPILMNSTGMCFVDASGFICMGRAASKEFREAVKTN